MSYYFICRDGRDPHAGFLGRPPRCSLLPSLFSREGLINSRFLSVSTQNAGNLIGSYPELQINQTFPRENGGRAAAADARSATRQFPPDPIFPISPASSAPYSHLLRKDKASETETIPDTRDARWTFLA